MEAHRERFFEKVERGDGCWIWTACKDSGGYGNFKYDKKMIGSHRFSYCLHNNYSLESISKLVIRHSCNNTACVNPSHLSIGTQQDNMNDRQAAGRQPHGETHGRCKLPDDTIRTIRAAQGLHKDIAAQFGIHRSVVCRIKNGKHRADVI